MRLFFRPGVKGSVNKARHHFCILVENRFTEQRDVGDLTFLNRSESIIDPQYFSSVDRKRGKCGIRIKTCLNHAAKVLVKIAVFRVKRGESKLDSCRIKCSGLCRHLLNEFRTSLS